MRAESVREDRGYCRRVLPHVSRTFAINIRLLSGSLRDAVEVGYLLCRTADALEDSWPGEPSAVEGRFDLLQAAIGGDEAAVVAVVLLYQLHKPTIVDDPPPSRFTALKAPHRRNMSARLDSVAPELYPG